MAEGDDSPNFSDYCVVTIPYVVLLQFSVFGLTNERKEIPITQRQNQATPVGEDAPDVLIVRAGQVPSPIRDNDEPATSLV
jgi:hypothetical protein